jgi:MurNAc alpha-1-phosphate uridylyltransferase
MPQVAMVLAAGLGMRLRPITENLPKPLVAVAGRSILDRVLDALQADGIERCVVNTHYLAEMIEAHLAARQEPLAELSHENQLLDTGGGVARALVSLGKLPFFVINADILWREGPGDSALARLAASFDSDAMDALLLLAAREDAVGYDGRGDFFRDPAGRLTRRGDAAQAPHVFTGLQILSPRLFAGCPEGTFSLNLLYDRAAAQGRLFGIGHTGRWFHIGTPEGLSLAEAALSDGGDAPPKDVR